MKKSTVLILIIVYLGSIFIVGVYGLNPQFGNDIVYCESIVPTRITLSNGTVLQGDQIKSDSKKPNTYNVNIPAEHYKEGLSVIIEYSISPDNCTYKDVQIVPVSTGNDLPASIVDGKIVFSDKGPFEVRFSATDQSTTTAVMNVRIRFR